MKLVPITALLAGSIALAACGGGKTRLSNRNTPDEFAISRAAPLVVPPDFTLAPPRPGTSRAIADDAQTNAAEALFGPGVKIAPKSPAEIELLNKAGADKADPTARSSAGDPGTATVNKGAFLREMMSAPVATTNPQVAAVTIGG